MITKENIENLLLEKTEGTEIFVVDIMINSGNTIIVHLDSNKGITLDECVEFNRFITGRLDKDLEDYNLEISSPGLDSPFKVEKQYLKYAGRKVELIMSDGKKKIGTLLAYREGEIDVEEWVKPEGKPGSKKTIPVVKTYKPDEFKSVKSVVSFK